MEKPCRNVTLAKSSLARVTRCSDCGCVAVDIGAFSFRVTDETLELICDTLTEATAKLSVFRTGRSWLSEKNELQ